MSIYGELDPMPEHETQFGAKDKGGHIHIERAKVNMSNMPCQNQNIDIEILHDSRDHVTVPLVVKITFNLESTNQWINRQNA